LKDDEGSLGTAHCKKMHVSKKLLPKKLMVKNLIFTNENWNFAAYRSIGQTYKRLNMVQNGSNSPTLKWFQIRKVTQYSFAPLRHCAHSRIRHTVLDSCNAHAMLRGWCFLTEMYVNG